MPEPEPISETLRALIDSDQRKLKKIAADAGVDYQSLRRWHIRATTTLDADMAEAVYKNLTGKPFVAR
jgi:hypothetical protein